MAFGDIRREVDVSQAPANGCLGAEPGQADWRTGSGRQGHHRMHRLGWCVCVFECASVESHQRRFQDCRAAEAAGLLELHDKNVAVPILDDERVDEIQANLEVEEGKGPQGSKQRELGNRWVRSRGRNEYGRYGGTQRARTASAVLIGRSPCLHERVHYTAYGSIPFAPTPWASTTCTYLCGHT